MPQQHYQAATYESRRSIGFLLKRAHLLLIERTEPALAAADLTFTQYVVLMHLREGEDVNPTVLCALLRHDSGALTRVLDQLEARGLIQRERSREDRRSLQLRLTEQGRGVIEAVIPGVVERLNDALAGVSRADFSELIRLLSKLLEHLETHAQTSASARPKRAHEPEHGEPA
jgi:DNA-binding MarR family transcriptional regulator